MSTTTKVVEDYPSITFGAHKFHVVAPTWLARPARKKWRLYRYASQVGAMWPNAVWVVRDADGGIPQFDSLKEAAQAARGDFR